MKIRFKVKHLLAIMLVFLVAGWTLGHVSEEHIFRRAEQARQAGEIEKSVALYDRYLQRCDRCNKADEALYWSAIAMEPDQRYGYVFTRARVTLYTIDDPSDGIDDAETRFSRLIREFPDSKHVSEAMDRLIDLLTYERRWHEAEAVLERAIEREQIESRSAAYARKRIEFAFDQGDYQKVIELSHQYEETWWQYNLFDVRLILGDAYRKLGRFAEARAAYDLAEQASKEVQYERRLQFGEPSLSALPMTHFYALAERRKLLERELALEHAGGGTVVGRIENYPQAGIMILLGDWAESSLNPGSPRRGFPSDARKLPDEHNYYTALTDTEGYFRLDNIPPGEYEIGLRYTPADSALAHAEHLERIRIVVTSGAVTETGFRVPLTIHPKDGTGLAKVTENQFQIAWEDVPGADYYYIVVDKKYPTLVGEGWTSAYWFLVETEESEYALDLPIFRWKGPRVTASSEDGRRLPNTFLGDYAGGEYRVYVNAYKDGEVIATSQTTDRHQQGDFVTTGVGELSYGEELILQERYEEAIEVFERRLAEDPNDLTAAQVLLRIYHYGTNVRTKAHQDAGKARDLLEHIMGLDIDPEMKESARFLVYGRDGV